jgi:hypothetical protein
VVFGDAVQCVSGRTFGRGEGPYSWWCIPIRPHRELRGCTVELEISSRRYDMLWITPLQDGPQKCVDLYPSRWVKVPLAARCEIDGALTIHPRTQPAFTLSERFGSGN